MFHSYVRLPDYQRFIRHFIGLFVATQCDKINCLTDWFMSKSCAGKYARFYLQYKFAWWSSCFALVNSCNYLLNIEFWLPLQLFFSLGNDRGKGLQFLTWKKRMTMTSLTFTNTCDEESDSKKVSIWQIIIYLYVMTSLIFTIIYEWCEYSVIWECIHLIVPCV